MRRLAFLFLLLSCAPLPAAAQADDAPADPCLDQPTEDALASCRLTTTRQQMATIARLDAVLMRRARGQPRLQQALRDASAAWLRHRDTDCRVDTWESASGTAGGTYLLYCRQQRNAARIAVLEERVSAP